MRAKREGDFKLYIDALTKIVPWFFALDHTNYARWIPLHLRDVCILKDIHPKVFAEFLKGDLVVKTQHRDSLPLTKAMSIAMLQGKMTEGQ